MMPDEKSRFTARIAAADAVGLRGIIKQLESMPESPDVLELLDVADDNLMALMGCDGDW